MNEESISDLPEKDDTAISESTTNVEKEEDTIILSKRNRIETLNKLTPKIEEKVNKMFEEFKQGRDNDFKEIMKFLLLSFIEMNVRVSDLESELEEITNQFYRNELSDEDFEEILMFDEEKE